MIRVIEQDLVTALTTLRAYRAARWRAVILYGMAGIGKTAVARALADDERVTRTFRDGIAWIDGSRDPEEEVTRLCLALNLERAPGERWVECWRRWASAGERRLLLIIEDATSAEGLPPIIAGLGAQVVVLITTQQGAEIRSEVERWLPATAVMELGVHGLTPDEGRKLVAAVLGRPPTDPECELVQEIGERIGWHPEVLRLAAIEGRESSWQGILDELRAGRMPWNDVRRLVMRQWARLQADEHEWLSALIRRTAPVTWLTTDEAARLWQVERPAAERRLWILEHGGLVENMRTNQAQHNYWRIAPAAHPILTSPACR